MWGLAPNFRQADVFWQDGKLFHLKATQVAPAQFRAVPVGTGIITQQGRGMPGQNVSTWSAAATSSSRNAVSPRAPSISGRRSAASTPQMAIDEEQA